MALVRSISTLSLVFILYFSTSGGAFTTETLVASVGPGMALLILLLVPLVYSIPEVLLVGELASMVSGSSAAPSRSSRRCSASPRARST